MKYPWVAISMAIIWLTTTYMILKRADMDVPSILLIVFVGTVLISIIGFRAPKIKN